jgi:hypothetical protein
MRLCLPARMGGGGKAESLPWRGPAGKARHTGATILLWEMRGQSPWRSHQSGNGASQAPNAATRHKQRLPSTARRQPDALRAGMWASGRPASREARVPAGQLKNAPPLGARSAGQSVSSQIPAHLPTLLIVTQRAKTTGLVRAANRAGRRQAARKSDAGQCAGQFEFGVTELDQGLAVWSAVK